MAKVRKGGGKMNNLIVDFNETHSPVGEIEGSSEVGEFLIDQAAEAIYTYEKCEPEHYEDLMGKPLKPWKSVSGKRRAGYRRQASAVLAVVLGEIEDRLKDDESFS
jgi:hypothetical protein